MGRREMREHIFKLLFLREFNQSEEMPEADSDVFESLEELAPMNEGLYARTNTKRFWSVLPRLTVF